MSRQPFQGLPVSVKGRDLASTDTATANYFLHYIDISDVIDPKILWGGKSGGNTWP